MSSSSPTSSNLPTPTEFPNADVVLYDGDCVFCTRGVQQLRWFDGGNRLAYLSLHDPSVAERYPDLSTEELMAQMYVIPTHDLQARYGGAAAIRYFTRRLPRLWMAAPLLHLPFSLPVWQWLYRQVAIRRYAIANKNSAPCDSETGTCDLHFQDPPRRR